MIYVCPEKDCAVTKACVPCVCGMDKVMAGEVQPIVRRNPSLEQVARENASLAAENAELRTVLAKTRENATNLLARVEVLEDGKLVEALHLGEAACLIACALEPISANWKKWEDAAARIRAARKAME